MTDGTDVLSEEDGIDVDIFATDVLVVEFLGVEINVVVKFGTVDGVLILLVEICESIESGVDETGCDDMEAAKVENSFGADESVVSFAAGDVVEDDLLLDG